MMNFKVLNKKEIKKILGNLQNQFSIKELNLDYVFLINRDNKIYITNRYISKIDLNKLRINNIGLYFAKIEDDGIRLSIEGSQIIGKNAKKNVIDLSLEDSKSWFLGKDLIYNGDIKGYIILTHRNDILGCGKIKNNKILNFIDKGRRIKTEDILYLSQ
ncbi:hypothetical protein J4455_03880 [Candidatus Woesearchaeota archaeon]|nr:hypothetical protein [Candidatus Woesearchaeota archaeon]